jgi:hypothetical protein
MDRILRGPGATVELQLYDAGGDAVDAGGGNGSAAVTDSAGVDVAGSPFTATRLSTGRYAVAIPATLTVLDVYDVVWTFADTTTRRSQFELVGTFLFTQAELRGLDAVLANETDFPDAALVNARENAEQRFEEAAEVSFTLRGDRELVDGNGRDAILSRHHELRSLVAAKIDGTAITAADVEVYPHGLLYRAAGWTAGRRNVELLVEHGYETVPEPVRRVGLLYARSVLLRSALEQSDRATAVFTDIGGYRLTLAGRDGPTGLPEVDAVLAQFGRRQAGSFA